MAEFSNVNQLLGNSAQWSQIPVIVNTTFRAILDLVSRQSNTISELEHQLRTRATHAELNQGLEQKASSHSMLQMINEHANLGRVQREITSVGQTLAEKANHNDVITLKGDIDLIRKEFNYESRIKEIQEEIYRQRSLMENMQHDQAKLHSEVVTQLELDKSLQRIEQDTKNSIINAVNPQINDLWNAKAEKVHIQDLRNEMKDDQRNEISDVDARLNGVINDLRSESKAAISNLSLELEGKLDQREQHNIREVILTETEHMMIRQTQDIHMQTEKMLSESYSDQRKFFQETQDTLDMMGKEILLKANINDMCTLLDLKANIDDINSVVQIQRELQEKLTVKANTEDTLLIQREMDRRLMAKANTDEIHQVAQTLQREIDGRLMAIDFHEHVTDQRVLNEQMFVENCSARWIWKSGRLRENSTVPWEVGIVNTCPDNYNWHQGDNMVRVSAPGLYQVSLGFFWSSTPRVQLLVNNEAVISGLGTPGSKQIARHSAGNICGTTFCDIISLPPESRISVYFEGPPVVEGFLSLRKL